MKFLLVFIILLELIILYKLITCTESFTDSENEKNMKLRKAFFDKQQQEKNKSISNQVGYNRGSNANKDNDYSKKPSTLGSDESKLKSTDKDKQNYLYHVMGTFRLKGDVKQLNNQNAGLIKAHLCKKLNNINNKSCKVNIKEDFYVDYIIDLNDVDIVKIKEKLKVGEKIHEYEIIEFMPPSITNKEYHVRKDSGNKLEDNYENKDRDTPDYYDWTSPISKPYVCSPPQEYDNTPVIEYQLTNGTPISFLDETTVGYILPKFYYKEY